MRSEAAHVLYQLDCGLYLNCLEMFGTSRIATNCVLLRRSFQFKTFDGSPNSYFNCLYGQKLHVPSRSIILSSSNFGCGRRHVRTAEETSRQSLSTKTPSPEDSLLLYRFKWIKHLRFISRVKILHVAVVSALTWPMSFWYSSGIISFPTLVCAIAGAAGTTAGLVALSFFFRRVVGEISFHEDSQTVIISSLTFWGNRRNRTLSLSSLVPLCDSGIDVKNTFHRLELYDSKDVYLLNLRHCKISDEAFFYVTGLHVDQTAVTSKK